MKAVLYARVSTEEQHKKETIASQIDEIKSFAEEGSYRIVEEFIDDGWSGSLIERPALDRLRDDARYGKFETMIVHHPDRLSRSQLHQMLLYDEFEKQNIKLLFVKVPEFNEGSEESRIVNKGVWSMVSELEKLRTRERTRRGKLNKARDGKIVCPAPIYGLQYDKKRKTFTVNEDEAPIVLMMFEWVRDGASSREVVRRLTKMKVKTRKGKTTWARSTVHRILSRETYATGTLFYNKYERVKPKQRLSNERYRKSDKTSHKPRPRDKWIPIKLPDDCKIISKELFEAVRKQMNRSKHYASRNAKNRYLLKGLVKCAACGATYYGDSFHGRPYYRCSSRYNSFPHKRECKAGSISAAILEPFVLKKMTDVILTPEVVIEEVRRFEEEWKQRQAPQSKDELQRQAERLAREKRRLVRSYQKGKLELSDVEDEVNQIKMKLRVISKQRAKKSERLRLMEEGAEKLCRDLRKLIRTMGFEKRKRLMQILVDHITFDSRSREIVISALLRPLERFDIPQHQDMPMADSCREYREPVKQCWLVHSPR